MAGTISSSASTPAPVVELSSQASSKTKAKSDDVGWEYAEYADPLNPDKLRCLLCAKPVTGGVYRMKQHIANIKGNVTPCPSSSYADKVKCSKAIEDGQNKKKQKELNQKEVREEVVIEEDEVEIDYNVIARKKRKILGPMNRFVSDIDPDSTIGTNKRMQQLGKSLFKERTHKVQRFVARWIYDSGIPFHAIENDSFKRMVEAIGQFGPGFKPPTQYQLGGPLLKEEVDRTKELLKKQEEEWEKNGCSIMTDAWTDRKRRSIMNLCVNCPEGTTFLSSQEASSESHTDQYIFDYVDKCIEELGPKCVVQVVTDNASHNMAAKDLFTCFGFCLIVGW